MALPPLSFAFGLVALWDGLQLQWLLDPDFGLATALRNAFRNQLGQTGERR